MPGLQAIPYMHTRCPEDWCLVKQLHKGRNFYIEDGKAYTEDDVLVYNVFMSKVPLGITKEQLEEFFGKFGDISKIGLTTTRKRARHTTQFGYVNFKDAKSAVKVLELEEYKIGQNPTFYVKACDTWHQPPPLELFSPETASPAGVYKKPKQSEKDDVDPGPAAIPSCDGVTLMDLHDDCLEHILKFLGIRDQLKFARVSQRFRDIVEILFKTQYRVLKCEDLSLMTLFEVRDFLILAGPHVDALQGILPTCDQERIIEFIIKYVSNDLKRLTLQKLPRKSASMRKFMLKFRALESLSFEELRRPAI